MTTKFERKMRETEQHVQGLPAILALRAGQAVVNVTPTTIANAHREAQRIFAELVELGVRETQRPADEVALRVAASCPTLTRLRRGTVPRLG
ncbi:MAG: hypothetical protein H0X67_15085 [Acidobacteria bacterium]|nr:hypothetical protein [Acidobacteriota bacterium]